MSESTVQIKIDNLSKVYNIPGGVVKALNNISLDIHKGDIYGIIGMSGAGKSTLIRCINKLDVPTDGNIYFNLAAGKLAHNPIREAVAAVSLGIVGGVPLLDLDYPEDSGCDSDINLVMTASGNIIEIQGTAEGDAFSPL